MCADPPADRAVNCAAVQKSAHISETEEAVLERISGDNLKIIENCISFSRQFLTLPDHIVCYFDDCPSQRFPTMINAAESNVREMFFNKPWFLQRTTEHRDDLEFFIFHELRHIHQIYSIFLCENNKPVKEDPSTLEIWNESFHSYVRNTGDATTQANVSQEVEIDANAYAQCLVNLLHLDDDLPIHLSLPDAAAELSMARSREYYNSKPEIARFVQARRNRLHAVQHTVRRVNKVGPNEPCPCGSGKKYKRCCRGKGIYD